MARQGEFSYGGLPGAVGDSIGASIVPAAKMLRIVKGMVEAKGKNQLGRVVETVRANFIDHVTKQFPGDLHFWGVGGMVYCNLAANRKHQLRSRFLVLITSREVTYDLSRCLGTSGSMGIPICHPVIDHSLERLACENMLRGFYWAGRSLPPVAPPPVPKRGRPLKAPSVHHHAGTAPRVLKKSGRARMNEIAGTSPRSPRVLKKSGRARMKNIAVEKAAQGSSSAEAQGSSSTEAQGSSSAEDQGSSSAEAQGSSSAEAQGSSSASPQVVEGWCKRLMKERSRGVVWNTSVVEGTHVGVERLSYVGSPCPHRWGEVQHCWLCHVLSPCSRTWGKA